MSDLAASPPATPTGSRDLNSPSLRLHRPAVAYNCSVLQPIHNSHSLKNADAAAWSSRRLCSGLGTVQCVASPQYLAELRPCGPVPVSLCNILTQAAMPVILNPDKGSRICTGSALPRSIATSDEVVSRVAGDGSPSAALQ